MTQKLIRDSFAFSTGEISNATTKGDQAAGTKTSPAKSKGSLAATVAQLAGKAAEREKAAAAAASMTKSPFFIIKG